MNKFTNNKGQVILDFVGVLAEDVSNTEFYVYHNEKVTTMKNEDYDKNKNLFTSNKPFWGAKVIIRDAATTEYLTANYNTEKYDGKTLIKCIKRKYMPSVFPPMFFGTDKKPMNGVIAKGSLVNVRCQEEQYTKDGKTHNKITLLGISVMEDNASTGMAEVKCTVIESEESKEVALLKNEIEMVRKQNVRIQKGIDVMVEAMLDNQKELLEELKAMRKELAEAKEEIKTLKAGTCQANDLPLQCEEVKVADGGQEWDIPDEMFDVDFNELNKQDEEEDDIEIPF